VRNDYERLHELIDDANLDAIAGIAACVPAIGRLNYLDDDSMTALIARASIVAGARVLDLGCGRGFLGRWLAARGHRVTYTGVDYAVSALRAVRGHLPDAVTVHGDIATVSGGPYDAIFAIESLWSVDSLLAAQMRAMLVPRGRIAIALSSLDSSQAGRVDTTLASLRDAGFEVERVALSASHAEAVGRLCAATLIEGPADSWVRERLTAEALRTLAALRDGTFRCDVFLAVASS
jgi:SAM-dependent methyltransferase